MSGFRSKSEMRRHRIQNPLGYILQTYNTPGPVWKMIEAAKGVVESAESHLNAPSDASYGILSLRIQNWYDALDMAVKG